MKEEKIKIVLTGGGSGGHVFPLIAVIREIKRLLPQKTELFYVGPKDEWVELYLSQEDVKVRGTTAGKIRRYITPKSVLLNFLGVFKIIFGCMQALFHLLAINPEIIFSKGGYGSIPVAMGGKVLGIPIFAHESDAVPGLSNRFISKLAIQTFVSFPNTEYLNPKKTIRVGNPVRREIFGGTPQKSKRMFNLSGEKPVLFVIGGSQGSQRINDLVLLILPQLLERFEVVHQCGIKNIKQVKKEAQVVMKEKQAPYYHPKSFLNEEKIKEAYFAADIIVSRAGSGVIFETACLSKALILIPLPESAQDHQYENAYRLEELNAAMVLEEKNITPQFFLEKLHYLIEHEEVLEKMRQNISHFAKPRAAKVIAHYLLEYILT